MHRRATDPGWRALRACGWLRHYVARGVIGEDGTAEVGIWCVRPRLAPVGAAVTVETYTPGPCRLLRYVRPGRPWRVAQPLTVTVEGVVAWCRT